VNNKIRIGFIYKKDYTFLNPNDFDKTTYYFFMEALKRNEEIDVIYYPSAKKFDCSKLEGKVDVILLPNNNTDGTPDELENIKNIDIPVICRTGDPHWAERKNQFQFHEKWKIDYYFNFMHRDYFYQFYPKDFKYRTITFGIESRVFENIDYDLKNRNKSKILNSGALGKRNFKSRLANRVLNPKKSGWYFYKLRTLCNNLDYVIHSRELEQNYQKLSYYEILSKYFAAIAATTFYPTIKYWETCAAGCLTFMEISELNKGEYLGFRDGENAIFINEENYKEKFLEYLSDINNPKWMKIAQAGKAFTMEKFSNDKAVKQLVKLFNDVL